MTGPPADRDAAIEVPHTVVELDVNHIDTADFDGPAVLAHHIERADTTLGGQIPPSRSTTGEVTLRDCRMLRTRTNSSLEG